jgi:hypothetical protein
MFIKIFSFRCALRGCEKEFEGESKKEIDSNQTFLLYEPASFNLRRLE